MLIFSISWIDVIGCSAYLLPIATQEKEIYIMTPHEMHFTTLELILIKDALGILSPDSDESIERLNRLINEITEEIYQNGADV